MQIQTVERRDPVPLVGSVRIRRFGPFSFVLPNIPVPWSRTSWHGFGTAPTGRGDRAPTRHLARTCSTDPWALLAIIGIAGDEPGSGASIGLAAPFEVVGIYILRS